MPKFDLLRRSPLKKFFWWEDRGDTYYQPDSEMEFPKSEPAEIIESVEIEHYRDLDHTKTGLIDEDSGAGWLSPEGKFYPVMFQGHSRVARYILNCSDYGLERAGWVHVHGHLAVLFAEYREPTNAQREWASANGHHFDDELNV